MRSHARRIVRILAGTACGLSILVVGPVGSASAAPLATPSSRPVVLIMAEHFDWAAAPSSLDGYAKALLSLHSADSERTSSNGWMSLGKGRRARVASPTGDLLPAPSPGVDEVEFEIPGWDQIVRHDKATHYGGTPGAFGDALEKSGRRWVLVTDDPGAALATVDSSGAVRHLVWGGSNEVRAALQSGVDVLVASTSAPGGVGDLIDAAGDSCIVVASVSSPHDAVHLGVFAASPQCGLGNGGLVSPSTRQFPFVTLIDVAPTVLDVAGIDLVSSMVGLPVTPEGTTSVQALRDEDLRARRSDRARIDVGWWFVAAGILGALLALSRRRMRHRVAMVWAALPVSTFLIMLFPWPPWGWFGAAVVATAITLGVAGVAEFSVGRRDPSLALFWIAVVTVVVLVGDAVRGGTLELDAPFGNSPIIAGRFAGLGNVAFGFSMGALLAACAFAMHRWGRSGFVGAVVACALFALAGSPWLGDKVGLVPVWIPTAGVLLLSARTGRVRLARLALVGAAAVALVAVFATFDLLHSDSAQSHLGRWLSSGDSMNTVIRKATSMGRTFLNGSIRFAVIAPLVVMVSRRREVLATPWVRSLALSLGTAMVLGTLLNDSGVEVAAAVASTSWPILVYFATHSSRTGSVDCKPEHLAVNIAP